MEEKQCINPAEELVSSESLDCLSHRSLLTIIQHCYDLSDYSRRRMWNHWF